jgi:adenylosuccinate synthase
MARTIVLLSGPIAAGKTTLCDDLVSRFGFAVFKTRELIQSLEKNVPTERAALQAAGEKLDRTTKGEWVAQALAQRVQGIERNQNVVVDSVRIKNQIGLAPIFETNG